MAKLSLIVPIDTEEIALACLLSMKDTLTDGVLNYVDDALGIDLLSLEESEEILKTLTQSVWDDIVGIMERGEN